MSQELHFIHPVVAVLKRCEDIVLALLGLCVLLLVTPFIAFKIYRQSPGRIFFHQLRVGRLLKNRSELFLMHKFRTMHEHVSVDAKKAGYDVDVNVRTQNNDPRIFSFAQFLRKCRLDELPQVINVLKGEMSIVGPRPDLPSALTEMQNQIIFYEDRTHSLRPGLTGLAQVLSGYTLSVDDIKTRADYDAAYAMTMSHPGRWLRCELKILWGTLRVVLNGLGH